MAKTRLRFALLISWFCIMCTISASLTASRGSLGIAPQDESYYMPNVIRCKDGSKKFSKQQLNDDFCDCPDGTDEPGTSACPEGRFFCRNVGHTPLTIFSSRVNDGICDCCDGSDEYNSDVKCTNTCWETGKVAREKLKKRIATFEEGVNLRKIDVEQAKQAYAKDEAELLKLKSEEKVLQKIVQNLKEQKEQIEKAEEERKQKEKEEEILRKEKEKTNEPEELSEPNQDLVSHDDAIDSESGHDAESEISDTSVAEEDIDDQNGTVLESEADNVVDTMKASSTMEEEASDNTQSLSREELGRLVASRWTGESADETTNEVAASEEEIDEDNIPDHDHEHDVGYTSDTDEYRHELDETDELDDASDDDLDNLYDSTESDNLHKDENDDLSDVTDSTTPSWLEKIQRMKDKVLQSFNWFKKPVDISEGARIRKEYDDSNSKLTKLTSRISSLSEKLKHDFGKEKEFYSFYGNCFEHTQNKYVYKVCPYKQANQVEGHVTTQLGRWDKFEDSYRVMQFSNGDRCWNGPDRSIKVKLRCGLKTELADVDEPSRCEYLAFLTTPALCHEEKLKELRQKLEEANVSQPPASRDEL